MEVLDNLGPVVHVQLGRLLGVHLRHDQLLVEVLSPVRPPGNIRVDRGRHDIQHNGAQQKGLTYQYKSRSALMALSKKDLFVTISIKDTQH